MGIAHKIARTAALLLVMSLYAWPVSAVTVPGLYSVEVPVASSQPDDLAQGYADGLGRVFVRVSGSSDVLDLEGVQALLDDAESLLQSYQYLRSEENGNRLRMAFGAVGVNNALASVNAPVWGANRPLTLAWIAVESGGSRTLLHKSSDSGSASPWLEAFTRAAEDRGLPITLPPEEFAGRRELMSDIWGQFTSNVRAASENLNHDLMSLVRVSRSGGEWRAGWVFDGMSLEGPEQSVTAASPQALADAVVGRWADAFAERYAVAGSDVGESPQVDIVVHGIEGLEGYGQANRVLKNLSPVQSAGATATSNGRVTIRVTFSGEIEQLKRYIALDSRLVPLSDAEVSSLPAETEAGDASTTASGPQAEPAENAAPPAFLIAPGTDTSSGQMFAYDNLLAGQDEAEQAFESLYQVLHYRWQPVPVVQDEDAE
ncbi:DUF2066 domain-containing protein [Marinobacter confluentis]|uniref:DUF2066 domain-containing protein n=1 Tax=Marinobacter confluentis TaxID=1697557 RepID=A0A4Z1C8B4_9GAMM|nr:DUF2066 domain-containing protein [Marinobacter confluentis]TGN41940.1 DUF2066 domain-containing protein [Marinobacter confluentis]